MKIKNKVSILFLVVGFLISAYFHFANINQKFIVGEDEIEGARIAVNSLLGFENPKFFGVIFLSSQPPLRALINIPFILIFGVKEWAIRFPHALFGFLTLPLLFFIAKELWGEREAIFTVIFYAVSGINSLNRLSLGWGLFIFLIILSFYALLKLLSSQKKIWLVLGTSSLILAFFTAIEAILFFIPFVGYLLLKRKYKSSLFTGVLFFLASFIYFFLWSFFPYLASRLGYLDFSFYKAGNIFHIFQRLSHVGAFNLWEIIRQYISYNSFVGFCFLLFCLIFSLFFRKKIKLGMVFHFFILHFLVWTFFFKNIMQHPMLDFPFLTLLAAPGFIYLFKTSKKVLKPFLCILFLLVTFSMAWYNYTFFIKDKGLDYEEIGIKTAGWYIRKNANQRDEFLSDESFGSRELSFYTGISESKTYLQDSKIRFFLIADPESNLGRLAKENLFLSVIVRVKGKDKILIYEKEARKEKPLVLDNEIYEGLFDQEYSYWRKRLSPTVLTFL